MDMIRFHSVFTVLTFVFFLGIIWWAFGPSRKARFERYGRLPLEEDVGQAGAPREGERS